MNILSHLFTCTGTIIVFGLLFYFYAYSNVKRSITYARRYDLIESLLDGANDSYSYSSSTNENYTEYLHQQEELNDLVAIIEQNSDVIILVFL